MEETPIGNAKRRVTVLRGNSSAGTLRGAWCIIAATVQGQSYSIIDRTCYETVYIAREDGCACRYVLVGTAILLILRACETPAFYRRIKAVSS
jgi:hypothetical protein